MKTYIIAEAGTGHMAKTPDQRVRTAKRFIRDARRAGADAVKFQMFAPTAEPLFCPLPGDDMRIGRWLHTALPLEEWILLQRFSREIGIDLLWSVFQPTCVEWLKELRPKFIKVASRAARDFPYDALPGLHLVSNGMDAMKTVAMHKIVWLQCCAEYPAPMAGFNARYPGLSDHSGTVWPGLDAIFHGAGYLEVHFKIPGADMGNDEPVCLDFHQLKLLCEARDAFARMHQG